MAFKERGKSRVDQARAFLFSVLLISLTKAMPPYPFLPIQVHHLALGRSSHRNLGISAQGRDVHRIKTGTEKKKKELGGNRKGGRTWSYHL